MLGSFLHQLTDIVIGLNINIEVTFKDIVRVCGWMEGSLILERTIRMSNRTDFVSKQKLP